MTWFDVLDHSSWCIYNIHFIAQNENAFTLEMNHPCYNTGRKMKISASKKLKKRRKPS